MLSGFRISEDLQILLGSETLNAAQQNCIQGNGYTCSGFRIRSRVSAVSTATFGISGIELGFRV